jgi:adenylate cyclase
MVTIARPADAIEFGLAMDRFVDAEPQFSALHIDAHHGSVLYREGDYVGGTVNLAARVASSGAAGEFLITEDLREAAGDLANAAFALSPPRRLKGIPDPLRLVGVRRRSAERSNRETNPVCGLLLHPNDVATRATWHGSTYTFAVTSGRTRSSKIPRASLPRNKISRPTNSFSRLKHTERCGNCRHPRSG